MEQQAYSDIDRALLRRLARGDRDALGALYDRHAARLVGMAVQVLGAREAAEDVVHDVFVEAWEHAGDYDPERGSVGAWLSMRLRSRCIDRLRRTTRQRTRHDDAGVGRAIAPEDSLPDGDTGRALTALQVLNPGEKSVVEALYFSGLSSSETANVLKIPIGTVKSRVRTALEKLRRELHVEAT